MRQTTVMRAFGGLLLAAALLAACADGGAGDGEAAGGSGPATAPTTPPTAPTAPTSTAPGSPGRSRVTVTGTLHDGVEPGCVLLRTEQGTDYLLVGGDRGRLMTGRRVQVTGVLSQDLMSICQQGTPLLVNSVKPVP
jgi:hypothetical protein